MNLQKQINETRFCVNAILIQLGDIGSPITNKPHYIDNARKLASSAINHLNEMLEEIKRAEERNNSDLKKRIECLEKEVDKLKKI